MAVFNARRLQINIVYGEDATASFRISAWQGTERSVSGTAISEGCAEKQSLQEALALFVDKYCSSDPVKVTINADSKITNFR